MKLHPFSALRSLNASIAFSLFVAASAFVVAPAHAAPYPPPLPSPTPSTNPTNRFWEPGTPISGGQLTAPTNNLQVAFGTTVNCTVTAATDSDRWRDQWSSTGIEADRILYNWTAKIGSGNSSSSSFSTPGYASTTWTAPSTPGTYTLTCTTYDDAAIPQGDVQGGTSTPSSSRTDPAVVSTVNVIVMPPSVTRVYTVPETAAEIMSGAMDDDDHTIVVYAKIAVARAGVTVRFEVVDNSPSTTAASLSVVEALTDSDGIAQTVLKSSNTDAEDQKVAVKAWVQIDKSDVKQTQVELLIPDIEYSISEE